jgi:hypothetical protein
MIEPYINFPQFKRAAKMAGSGVRHSANKLPARQSQSARWSRLLRPVQATGIDGGTTQGLAQLPA